MTINESYKENGTSPRNYEYFLAHENRNTSSDFTIMRFVIQLKKRLKMGEGGNFMRVIDSCVAGVRILFLNLFLKPFLIRKPKYNKKYNVSICAIFKNEGRFIQEWLKYHQIVGIEHFYLYDNCSDDNYRDIIQPFIDKGLVTLIDWPHQHAQIQAYKHFYEKYRHETQWVTFLDLDEFVVPRNDVTILDWLKKRDCRPVNLIYWKMFGTSGLMKHDEQKLVIEQYTVSWERLYECGKCFVNTDYDIADYNGSTHHETRIEYPILGGLFKIVLPPLNQFGFFAINNHHSKWAWKSDCGGIQINHYWSKSWDIYDSKRQKTDVFFEKNPKQEMWYFYAHEEKNTSCDFVIFRYLIRLKLELGIDC